MSQVQEKTCICGEPESQHAKDFPRVSKKISGCWGFQPKFDFPTNYEKYLNELPQTKDKIKWLLENISALRNENNQLFVLDYMVFTVGSKDEIILHLLKSLRSRIRYLTIQKKIFIEDWETVRRSKQLLVASNPEKYGEYDPKVSQEKQLKQVAIEEFLTQGVSDWE